jgi:hypothetical protein
MKFLLLKSTCTLQAYQPQLASALIKKKKKFLIYKEICTDGIGCKAIYEEMHKYFHPYMRRPLVMYDFAPDPSEFPYI